MILVDIAATTRVQVTPDCASRSTNRLAVPRSLPSPKRRNLYEVEGSRVNFSQGSSLLATLGWRTQSRWD